MKSAKKKTQKQNCEKKPILTIRYGVAIPEKQIIDLIESHSAKMIAELANKVSEMGLFADKSSEDFWASNGLNSIMAGVKAGLDVLQIVEEAWADAVHECTRSEKATKKPDAKGCKPCSDCKPQKPTKSSSLAFSPKEIALIEKLRKQGKSLKFIGKAIHHSDKAVSAYLKKIAR